MTEHGNRVLKKRVMVTGGSGLVGNAVKKVCAKYSANYDFVFLSSKDGDLCDYTKTKRVFEKHRPHIVIHLAGNVGGLYKNMVHKVLMYEDNVKMNMNVVECSHMFGVEILIGCLSTCIFPDKVVYPINEDMLHDGEPHYSNNGYAYAKRMMDIHMRTYREQYGCKFICVTPCNIYGEYDNYDMEDGHVIPALIHKCFMAKKEGSPFVVKGSGKPLRQFIYSVDLADIILLLLTKIDRPDTPTTAETTTATTTKECGRSIPSNMIASVGEDGEMSIADIARLIAKQFDYEHALVFDRGFADGQYKKTVCNDRLLDFLGGEYEFTKIEDGIKNSVTWFCEHYGKDGV